MVAVRAVHAIDMSARDRKFFEILRRVPRRFAGSWEGGVWGAGQGIGGAGCGCVRLAGACDVGFNTG